MGSVVALSLFLSLFRSMLWCGDSRRLNVWIAHRYDRGGGIKRERKRASEREREREVRVCVW
jgi:hypothetical protein